MIVFVLCSTLLNCTIGLAQWGVSGPWDISIHSPLNQVVVLRIHSSPFQQHHNQLWQKWSNLTSMNLHISVSTHTTCGRNPIYLFTHNDLHFCFKSLCSKSNRTGGEKSTAKNGLIPLSYITYNMCSLLTLSLGRISVPAYPPGKRNTEKRIQRVWLIITDRGFVFLYQLYYVCSSSSTLLVYPILHMLYSGYAITV